ncbi:DUF417 family protein, partial [Streptosporangium lutulentum]|uniref:DUF417 family protein n=1 Tax=Streptosporangium lutulentum TaxID=1461250 RepID=UPI003630935B
MTTQPVAVGNLQMVGASTLRFGLALNLMVIGRLKFEDYEVENIRPLITSSPPFSRLATMFGEQWLARLIGMTVGHPELVGGSDTWKGEELW